MHCHKLKAGLWKPPCCPTIFEYSGCEEHLFPDELGLSGGEEQLC